MWRESIVITWKLEERCYFTPSLWLRPGGIRDPTGLTPVQANPGLDEAEI